MNETELKHELELHHKACFGWALSCCSGYGIDPEDVLQTAYLKILQGRARFEGRSSFKTWLFSVIARTAAEERRRSWTHSARIFKFISSFGAEEPAAEEESLSTAEEPAAAMLRKALRRLPRRQKEVLHLVFYQELSIQEASLVMGVSLSSARTHYERGKGNLRGQLEELEARHETA